MISIRQKKNKIAIEFVVFLKKNQVDWSNIANVIAKSLVFDTSLPVKEGVGLEDGMAVRD